MSDEPGRNRPAVLEYNEPGSVGTLKKSYRGKLELPEPDKLVSELMGESDRAAIILASSLLDDLLANAIALKMPGEILVSDVDWIFRQSGPLGSFSARIEIASLFNVIENETFVQLTVLREMRNACAHTKRAIDFGNPLLANVMLHFFKNASVTAEMVQHNPKASFCIEVAFLAIVLSHGSRETALSMRKEAMAEHVTAIIRSGQRSTE